MPLSLDQFAERMERRAERLPGVVADVLVGVVHTIAESVIVNTPVDEGIARSNWQVTLGDETYSELPAYHPIPKGTDPEKFHETANAEAALAVAEGVIATIGPAQAYGVPIYVQNNKDYIVDLNHGDSVQHGGQFVEHALIEARSYLSELKFDIDGGKV